jgi:hypothetical protein
MRTHKIEVIALKPTQVTVGMREVADKRRELAHMSKDERHEFLQNRPIPVVLGPEQRHYLIDHHHLARALWDDAFEHAWIEVKAELVHHSLPAFWQEMERRQWVYPHDAHGHVLPVSELPAQVSQLVDDPYRSLAGYLRKAGGFIKSETPFAEFAWANFLRNHVQIPGDDAGFAIAVKQAITLAHSTIAAALPGFTPTKAS